MFKRTTKILIVMLLTISMTMPIANVKAYEENYERNVMPARDYDNFDDNFNRLEKSNLGKIARELENLDYSDDRPELSDDDYDLIDDIREIRNYWCHQCYLDFVYINNNIYLFKAFKIRISVPIICLKS